MSQDSGHDKNPDAGDVSETSATCPRCGLGREWESLVDRARREERWLTICECGHMEALVPGEESDVPLRDPLRAYLFGTARPRLPEEAPPWIRLFLHTTQQARPIRWRYIRQPCPGCGTAVQMSMEAYPDLDVFGRCTLCLSCGHATAAYTVPTRDTASHVSGTEWAPACPAVKRLRECALRPYKVLYVNGWGSPASVVSSDDDWDSFFGQ